MEDFLNVAATDAWNHAIYSSILKFLNFEKIDFIKKTKTNTEKLINKLRKKKNTSPIMKEMIIRFMSLFSRNNNYFFNNTYVSSIDIVKLQVKLGQVPIIYKEKYTSEIVVNENFRNMSLSGFKCNSQFEKFAVETLLLQMPIAYLEGYSELVDRASTINWPENPKIIWTSNSYFMDEIFKVWTAGKVENGVPLVIGQHGGHYGQGLFSATEYHELKICDHYLSWGWGEGEVDRVIPVGALKKPIKRNNKRTNKSAHNNSILLLISGTSRYSGGLASFPISGQWINYLDDQMEFYQNLPICISNNVITRLYPSDYGWSQFRRWKDRFPESKIDVGDKDFNYALRNTKLFISGWNTTTYLESMLSNVPTVIFWEPKYFEIRDSAKELFKELKKVGIWHDNPVSAAKHINTIYDDIDSWWDRPDVISARNNFTYKYAQSNNLLNKLSDVLKNISDRKC